MVCEHKSGINSGLRVGEIGIFVLNKNKVIEGTYKKLNRTKK